MKSKEYRFRTSNLEIVELIEGGNNTFSKNIENILRETVIREKENLFFKRENEILRDHNKVINDLLRLSKYLDSNQSKNEPILDIESIKSSLINYIDSLDSQIANEGKIQKFKSNQNDEE